MSITLCMTLKDEADILVRCLDSVLPHVDEVLITDTGSVDGTRELLADRYGIRPLSRTLEPARFYSVTDVRNELYGLAKTDWVFYLDADEVLAGESGPRLVEATRSAPASIGGFFGKWSTQFEGEEVFEDYKLFTFRRGYRKRGLAHANVQLDIREKGGRAAWLDGFVVAHFPKSRGFKEKRKLYRWRLSKVIAYEPGWFRHNWFAGYMEFQDGDHERALALFRPLIESRSRFFPVEGLNARMVAIDALLRLGRADEARKTLDEALSFFAEVCDDFEVAINFRIRPWLLEAGSRLAAGDLDGIRAYRFSC
ncbi:MAG: glycosyltransferase family 2 protein [Rhizobiales bacterium]|nr:glycosyltransferase family 2 protein [Hyphomicrobiales bacterium]